MKIAVVSKADSCGGGASRVAEELTDLFLNNGFDVHHWFSWSGTEIKPHNYFLYGITFGKYVRHMQNFTKKFGFPEIVPFELITFIKKRRLWDYDLVHFHDLSSAISPYTVRFISKFVPTVWTIHDCSAYTGGCLYPMDCKKYQTKCSNCPQIGQWPIDCGYDFTGFMQSIKRNLFKKGRVVPITPSKWMSETANLSKMFGYNPIVIPNGIDTNIFYPYEKKLIRKELKLPEDRKIILVSAGYIKDERKGAKYSIDALHNIKNINPYVLVIGNMDENGRKLLSGLDYYEAGYVVEKEKLAKLYAAADLFLFCSLADNMPLCVLETMATATPLVGFHVGGIPEMVIQGETGLLVKPGDTKALIENIKFILQDNNVEKMGKACRKRVEKHFSHDAFFQNHLNLYQDVIAGKYEIYKKV